MLLELPQVEKYSFQKDCSASEMEGEMQRGLGAAERKGGSMWRLWRAPWCASEYCALLDEIYQYEEQNAGTGGPAMLSESISQPPETLLLVFGSTLGWCIG